MDAPRLKAIVQAARQLAYDSTMTAWETAGVAAALLSKALSNEQSYTLQEALIEYDKSRTPIAAASTPEPVSNEPAPVEVIPGVELNPLKSFEVTMLLQIAKGFSLRTILDYPEWAAQMSDEARIIATVIECHNYKRPIPEGTPYHLIVAANDFILMAQCS